MTEASLSINATDFGKGLKGWFSLLSVFVFVAGVSGLLVFSLGTWGDQFLNVKPGPDSFVMAIGFLANIGLAFTMLYAAFFAGIDLVAGSSRLCEIYSNKKRVAEYKLIIAREKEMNWLAQMRR